MDEMRFFAASRIFSTDFDFRHFWRQQANEQVSELPASVVGPANRKQNFVHCFLTSEPNSERIGGLAERIALNSADWKRLQKLPEIAAGSGLAPSSKQYVVGKSSGHLEKKFLLHELDLAQRLSEFSVASFWISGDSGFESFGRCGGGDGDDDDKICCCRCCSGPNELTGQQQILTTREKRDKRATTDSKHSSEC